MKVLLLSNKAGQGHHSTAGAIAKEFTSHGAECRVLDTYAYVDPLRYRIVDRGYLTATARIPGVYGFFYKKAERLRKNDSKYTPINIDSRFLASKLRKYIENVFMPDVIICTHVFSAQVINAMKAMGWIKAPAIGIVTDYTIHPFWQDVTRLDYLVTASELLTPQAVKKGISAEKILPLGIPINHKFNEYIDKEEARRQLGIDVSKKTVLLMSGSMGYGNIAETIKKIDNVNIDFQVLAVCGNNMRAKNKIDGIKTKKKVYCYGFVNNVDVMMSAADCIITKPGGLSTSEALAKHLPIILINPIPGQEQRNVEFMLNNGVAMFVTDTFPVDEALYQIFMFPDKLKNMAANIRLIAKPNAARDLANFVTGLLNKDE